jgi:hypothetical protein
MPSNEFRYNQLKGAFETPVAVRNFVRSTQSQLAQEYRRCGGRIKHEGTLPAEIVATLQLTQVAGNL